MPADPQEKAALQAAYTCIVLNKEIKSDKYILEVSNRERHEYVEVSQAHWDRIKIGDSAAFDASNVLIGVNGEPLE